MNDRKWTMNKKTLATLNQIKQIFLHILCIYCLTAMLLHLHDMGNEMFENFKNVSAAKALLMLSIFMLVIQKARLINWQTLVASLLYWHYASIFLTRYINIPDLYKIDEIVVWVGWVLVLIITDMLVYKKVNPITRFRLFPWCLFLAMTFAMTYCRNGRAHPLIFVFAFVFYLIPLNNTQWRTILNQLCTAWILTFFIVWVRSVTGNYEIDETVGRWFGDFLNIGDFGVFMACITTIILFKLYQSKQLYGRKSFSYLIYLLCLLPLLWTIFRVSTITMFIGIACIFLTGYVIVRGNTSRKNVLFRTFTVVFIILLVVLLVLLGLKLLANTNKEYWNQVLLEGNTFLKPIASLIKRAHYMFDETRTFAKAEVFDPDSIINYLDLFSSGRLSIIVTFAEHFNFLGNPSAGIQVGAYMAANAHNNYTQMLYEYGYLGGGLFIIWSVYTTLAAIRQYLREKRISQLLLCLWMPMSLGVYLGERINPFAAIFITSLLLTYPLMVQIPEQKSLCKKG